MSLQYRGVGGHRFLGAHKHSLALFWTRKGLVSLASTGDLKLNKRDPISVPTTVQPSCSFGFMSGGSSVEAARNKQFTVFFSSNVLHWLPSGSFEWSGLDLSSRLKSDLNAELYLQDDKVLLRGYYDSPSFLVDLCTTKFQAVELPVRLGQATNHAPHTTVVGASGGRFLVAGGRGVHKLNPNGILEILKGDIKATSLSFHEESGSLFIGDLDGGVSHFHWDGPHLRVGSEFDLKNTILTWNVGQGNSRQAPTRHAGEVTALSFALEQKRLVSASGHRAPNSVQVWDLESGELVNRFTESAPSRPRHVGCNETYVWAVSSERRNGERFFLWEISSGDLVGVTLDPMRKIEVDSERGRVGMLGGSSEGEIWVLNLRD